MSGRNAAVATRAERPTWPAWEWPRYEAGRIRWPEYKGKLAKDKPRD